MNAQRYEKKMIPPNFFVKKLKNALFFLLFSIKKPQKRAKCLIFTILFELFATSRQHVKNA